MESTMFQAFLSRLQQPASAVPTIDPAELQKLMKSKNPPLLVDVRSAGEYEQDGHIAGSRLLPLGSLGQRASELPQDKPIVCVCRSGARSHVACEQLQRQGFTNVTNLTGGVIGWRRAGLPLK
jgi:rhodanese-related sulfurtransferase